MWMLVGAGDAPGDALTDPHPCRAPSNSEASLLLRLRWTPHWPLHRRPSLTDFLSSEPEARLSHGLAYSTSHVRLDHAPNARVSSLPLLPPLQLTQHGAGQTKVTSPFQHGGRDEAEVSEETGIEI